MDPNWSQGRAALKLKLRVLNLSQRLFTPRSTAPYIFRPTLVLLLCTPRLSPSPPDLPPGYVRCWMEGFQACTSTVCIARVARRQAGSTYSLYATSRS
eukprot:COSAG06_NODE_2999_length_5980_cov_4.933345_2_plen_98_part_00